MSCPFCNKDDCYITKVEMISRGPILEPSVSTIIKTYKNMNMYVFNNTSMFGSFSALIPDMDSDNPHAYKRLWSDNDDNYERDFENYIIDSPLSLPTETEIINKIKARYSYESNK